MPHVLEGDLPVTATGSTAEADTTNAFSYAQGVCPGNLDTTEGNDGVDQVWSFTPEETGNYTFELNHIASFSGAISYLMGSCDSAAFGCLGGLPYYDTDPVVSFLEAWKTYHFVIDAYDGASSWSQTGEYQFTVDHYDPCFSADCAGKECGDNGCGDGALCGTCAWGEVCGAGTCQDPTLGETCSDPFYVSVSATESYAGDYDTSYAANDYEKKANDCDGFGSPCLFSGYFGYASGTLYKKVSGPSFMR